MKYVPNQGLASLSVCCQRRLTEDCVHAPCFSNPCIWIARTYYTTYSILQVAWRCCGWVAFWTEPLVHWWKWQWPHSDTYSADMMPIWVLIPPKPCIVMPMKHKSFCQIDPLEFQPRRAIANVSSFPISYFISLTSHLSLHSGLHVFSCTIRYYLIPQVFPWISTSLPLISIPMTGALWNRDFIQCSHLIFTSAIKFDLILKYLNGWALHIVNTMRAYMCCKQYSRKIISLEMWHPASRISAARGGPSWVYHSVVK